MTILSSNSPRELLSYDMADPFMRIGEHPLWKAIFSGQVSVLVLREMVGTLYPALAGNARYLFSSKVSRISLEHGKAVFKDLYESLTVPEANADTGWHQVGIALGLTERDLADAFAKPKPEADDFVAITREHGHRTAHEGVGAAWAVERQLPELWGALADGLQQHYGLKTEDVGYLRYEAGRVSDLTARIDEFVDTYLVEAMSLFEARRAAREVMWSWRALCDTVGV